MNNLICNLRNKKKNKIQTINEKYALQQKFLQIFKKKKNREHFQVISKKYSDTKPGEDRRKIQALTQNRFLKIPNKILAN